MVACDFPLRYIIATLALRLHRQQQAAIDDLKEGNRLLKEKLGDRKLHFGYAERRRLAVRAGALGRKLRSELDTRVTPDTLLRWHRERLARKWNHVHKRKPGRTCTQDERVELILRMAAENPTRGCTRLLGALRNLGYKVGRGRTNSVLAEHGIDPAPLRGKRTACSTVRRRRRIGDRAQAHHRSPQEVLR